MEVINENENNINDDLFYELVLKERIIIEPKYLNNKINQTLVDRLKNKIEEKCISEGYVKKNSIEVIKKGLGLLKGSQFNGNINYELLYKAHICNPKVGSIIQAKVKFINKLGVLAKNGPLTIIVGRQFHSDPNIFDEINPDDVLDVEVIASKFSLDDKEIKIIAKLKLDHDNDTSTIVLGDLIQMDDDEQDDNELNEDNMSIHLDEQSDIGLDDLDLESLNGDESEEEEDNEDDEDNVEYEDEIREDEEPEEIDDMDEEDQTIDNIQEDE